MQGGINRLNMTIDGYKVVCFGVRRKPYPNSNNRPLKEICKTCGLYHRYQRFIKPVWRIDGFIKPNAYKCKLKELYGKQKE